MREQNYSTSNNLQPWSSFISLNVECGDESPHSTNSTNGLNDDHDLFYISGK